MEIKKAATAGTLESSDCMVTVEPGEGKIDFSLESSVIHQYGNQLRKVALETLKNLDIDNVRITIVDKGEYQKLMDFMNREDPRAFITVYTVSDMRYQPKT